MAKVLSNKTDFVKAHLLFSEDYALRKSDPRYFGWKGMDPGLLKSLVQKAHAAGLRVSTHVESAVDFHNALAAGVDEINHLPGFRTSGDVKPHRLSEFEISEADVEMAAHHGVYMVTTLGDAAQIDPSGPDSQQRKERDDLNRRNLALLKKHRVRLALGSDNYRSDTVPEALYIQSLNVFDNRSLLTIWCVGTARTIFPHRKIGELKEGYEVSFVVLEGESDQRLSSSAAHLDGGEAGPRSPTGLSHYPQCFTLEMRILAGRIVSNLPRTVCAPRLRCRG
jgi:imidazolonepropionase-like amidohydrolase